MIFLRALEAVRLLTRIRNENPELWERICEFAQGTCSHDWRGVDVGRMCSECGKLEKVR